MKNIQKIVLRSTDMQTISARLPGLTGEKNVINNGKKNTHIKLYIQFFLARYVILFYRAYRAYRAEKFINPHSCGVF